MSVQPWHQDVWHELVRRQQSSGLPHALLLTGLEGIGKHQLALHAAQWLLCLRDEAEPCGACHSCQLWAAGSHPDFMLCQPEDGSRQIRIDAIRKINNFLAQTPQISRCQVVSLRPVEVMNTNAANALLKTLEEPAGESFLLLETERFGSVLPTIRSRCQRLQLSPPGQSEALSWLQQQGFAADVAEPALRMNHQAPLKALDWLTREQSTQQQRWFDLLRQWSLGQIPLQAAAEGWNKLEFQDVTSWFYSILSDCLKAKLGISAQQLVFTDQVFQLLSCATLNPAKLITLQHKVQAVLGQLLSGGGNYNKQLLLESLLLDWQQIVQDSHRGEHA